MLFQLSMNTIVILSLLVIAFSQDCTTMSPYCNQCDYLCSVLTCTNCTSNAFTLPVIMANGMPQGSCGQDIWTCQLCANVDPQCLTCTYTSGQSNNMVCLTCVTGYGPNQFNPTAPIGTCQMCSANCLSCSFVQPSPGVANCSVCASNAFMIPVTVTGASSTINQCQLCSAAGSNCLTCTYDPNLASNMFCSTCVAGYAVVIGSVSNQGSCQSCGSGCLTCQSIASTMNGCGASVNSGDCGSNGMMCQQCASGYVLAINSNCYPCSSSTAVLANSSNENKGLIVGLSIWIGLTAILTITFISLYIRNRAAKGESGARLLNGQIEVGQVNQ